MKMEDKSDLVIKHNRKFYRQELYFIIAMLAINGITCVVSVRRLFDEINLTNCGFFSYSILVIVALIYGLLKLMHDYSEIS